MFLLYCLVPNLNCWYFFPHPETMDGCAASHWGSSCGTSRSGRSGTLVAWWMTGAGVCGGSGQARCWYFKSIICITWARTRWRDNMVHEAFSNLGSKRLTDIVDHYDWARWTNVSEMHLENCWSNFKLPCHTRLTNKLFPSQEVLPMFFSFQHF